MKVSMKVIFGIVAFAACMLWARSVENSVLFEYGDTKVAEASTQLDPWCLFSENVAQQFCIPRLKVKGNVTPYAGAKLSGINSLLKNSVVWLQNGANFGESGNTVLFGHSSDYPWDTGPYKDIFSNLNLLQKGDTILLFSSGKISSYRVMQQKIISARDLSAIQNTSQTPMVTLITCWPKGTSLKRLVVTAEIQSPSSEP